MGSLVLTQKPLWSYSGTPGNISCIYHYNVKFTCSWIPGKETYLTTKYTLIRKLVKQLLNVTWDKPDPTLLDLNCRLRYRNTSSNTSVTVNFTMNQNERRSSFNLTDLWDCTEYAIAIQCVGVESEIWSEWSEEKIGRTEQQAPSRKVDLWRVIESSPSAENRYVHLMWKVLKEYPSSECLLGYKIQYCPENNAAFKMTHNTTDKVAKLLLTGEAYVISVVAYNSVGESPEATLRIPSIGEKSTTLNLNEQMVVEWEASVSEINRYVIEWYEELETEALGRSWQYILNTTKWTAKKDAFKPFKCYNISVYPLHGNKIGTPHSIQAYVQEGRPSVGPVAKTNNVGKNEAMIKWKTIPKDKRNGFIINYTIFYKPEGGKELNETVNSDVLQYRLKSLQANTQYTAHVMAATKAGGTHGNRITFSTLKFNFVFVIISFGFCLLLLLILGITCTLKKHT
uniref:Interleukin 31 receptor A n=1 Tax=Chelonoidis abingdonii TaxID=106734 RepID=A0A8C0IPJ3_CHEAB